MSEGVRGAPLLCGLYCDQRCVVVVGCSLSWLDLSWNSFDSASGVCLAEALAVNMTLTSIDLSANSLRDTGGQSIAACLLQNKNLQEIFLSMNNIGGKSCFIFSKVSTSSRLSYSSSDPFFSIRSCVTTPP